MFLEHLYDKHTEILNKIETELNDNGDLELIVNIMSKLEELPDTPEGNQIYYVFYKEDIKWLLGRYLKEKYNLNYLEYIED